MHRLVVELVAPAVVHGHKVGNGRAQLYNLHINYEQTCVGGVYGPTRASWQPGPGRGNRCLLLPLPPPPPESMQMQAKQNMPLAVLWQRINERSKRAARAGEQKRVRKGGELATTTMQAAGGWQAGGQAFYACERENKRRTGRQHCTARLRHYFASSSALFRRRTVQQNERKAT